MIFIIATTFNLDKTESYFFWTGKYFSDIKKYLPNKIVDNLSIHYAIVYQAKKEANNQKALLIKITRIELTANYLKLNYKIIKEIEYTAFQIRNALKIYLNKSSILELPFCIAVDESKISQLLENTNIENKITILEKTNNWTKIYELLKSLGDIKTNNIWNNSHLLNRFAFATAKLSECTENLKRKYPDNQQRKKIIQEKKQLRELTILLRQRCIQLDNNNPTYHSNLAYTHYQSALELTTPGGRRDGDLNKECELAINYLDKSLELDQNRITDIFRKAIIISEIQTNSLLFKSDNIDNEKKLKASQNLNEAVILFEKIINLYENSLQEENLIKRYAKYYIKSLFKLAALKLKIAKNGLNPLNILYNGEILSNIFDINTNTKINLLKQAKEHIEKCINEDAKKSNKKNYNLLSLFERAEINNFTVGVYKIYLYGKIELYNYILTKDKNYLDNAKKLFQQANEVEFPRELKNQRKIFILEKLAISALLESKFNQAIKILESQIRFQSNNNKKIFLPDYAAYTLSIAYILNGQFNEAESLISNNINNCNEIFLNKFNKLKAITEQKNHQTSIKLLYSMEENVA